MSGIFFWILLMYFYQLSILVVDLLVESHRLFALVYFLYIACLPSLTTWDVVPVSSSSNSVQFLNLRSLRFC